MSLLQDLPTRERFDEILSPVIGNGDGGGVGGVANLLGSLDIAKLAGDMTSRLDGTLTVSVSGSADGGVSLTGDFAGQFRSAVSAFPSDPAVLVAPVREKLESIRSAAVEELGPGLLSGLSDLRSIRTLIPADRSSLFADIAPAIDAFRGELLSGTFGELREWSGAVGSLQAELAPLVSAGPDGLTDRLIEYLRKKIEGLVAQLLPLKTGLADALAADLRGAISADRVTAVASIRASLLAELEAAELELSGGNASNTLRLAAAEERLAELVTSLEGIQRALLTSIDGGLAGAAALTAGLERQIDAFDRFEVVDVGNVREKLVAGIAALQDKIDAMNLEIVGEKVREVFDRINTALAQADIGSLASRLGGLQEKLDGIMGAIDGAVMQVVAAIRSVLRQAQSALESVVDVLGSVGEDGRFHFAVEGEIRDFLQGIRAALQDTVQPLIAEFRGTIEGVLQQVTEKLALVQGEIDTVKAELASALQGASAKLDEIDVPATMEQIRQKLQGMLDELGTVDFDVVADPVVAQINEMRDALKEIDVSSMNEVVLGTLKVSVSIVVELDFTAKITDVLMAKIDELLAYPKGALAEIETKAEDGLKRLGDLAPSVILAPLEGLFTPVREKLDELRLERLVQPLDEWHGRALAQLDTVSPAALLAPVIAIFDELRDAAEAISPERLIAPLRQLIDDATAELERLDLTSLTAELSGITSEVQAALDSLDPGALFAPLVEIFAKLVAALERFDPAALLEPLNGVFAALTDPLADLAAEQAAIVQAAFAPLLALPAAFDPARVYGAAREAANGAVALLQELAVGRMLAELKPRFDSLQAAAQASASVSANAGNASASASASIRVDALNPLRHEALGSAIAGLQDAERRLVQAAQSLQPPASLTARYENVRTKLESLVPDWAKGEMTADSIRRAFRLANPLALGDELRQLWAAVVDKVKALDPALLQDEVRGTYEQVKQTILSLDPAALVADVQHMLDQVVAKLTSIDLDLVVSELGELAGTIHEVVAGLDPRPIIAELDAIMGEVRSAVEALKPSELLAALEAPLEGARNLVLAFDPAAFAEPLQAIFERIQEMLGQIDVGAVLGPLIAKLDELRNGLEAALRRTEGAFNGMLQAIPASV